MDKAMEVVTVITGETMVKVIDFAGCEGFAFDMAMEVLSRCPRLQVFSRANIQLKDLIQLPQEQ